ncbi:hypothetical protein [Virgibacillus sp. DJP39]|uniref:hypothetical protein n=1 Tax=Virgibacillus sp. DJP39 TaxID=3409790 RepID=UPI003BB55ECA
MLVKKEGGWKLNDLPFVKKENDFINTYFLEGHEQSANAIDNHVNKIVSLYKDKFDWQPESLNIKLFNSNKELAATIPFGSDKIASWNEYREALKVVDGYEEAFTHYFLQHEITHQFLSHLTNDNCLVWFQEGFANYFSEAINKNAQGQYELDIRISHEASQEMIDRINDEKYPTITTIINAKNKDAYGYLLIDYLIQMHSLDKFVDMILKNYPYIDKRMEHKSEDLNTLLLETLEKHYVSLETLSKEYSNYHK